MKVQYDKLLSTIAFKFNLRRYSMAYNIFNEKGADWNITMKYFQNVVRGVLTTNTRTAIRS